MGIRRPMGPKARSFLACLSLLLLVPFGAAGQPAPAVQGRWTLVEDRMKNEDGSPQFHFDGHTATPLRNGGILVAGGFAGALAENFSTSKKAGIVRIEPSGPFWSPVPDMLEGSGRTDHEAVALQDGRALVAGGTAADQPNTSELFDPAAAGSWTDHQGMPVVQAGNAGDLGGGQGTGVLLSGPRCAEICGRVVYVGGNDVQPQALIFDPNTKQWTPFTGHHALKSRHGVVLLDGPDCRNSNLAVPDYCGKVLVAGGGVLATGAPLNTALLLDPSSDPPSWTETGTMSSPRLDHTLTLLDGPFCAGPSPPSFCGKVLAVGGFPGIDTAELYDPSLGIWVPAAPMSHRRYDHSASLLPDGKVLVAGGQNEMEVHDSVERYDPASGTWVADADLPPVTCYPPPCVGADGRRRAHAAVSLPDGRVLIAGGMNVHVFEEDHPTGETLLIYEPASADLNLAMSDMPDPGRVGEDVVYTITITNHGPDSAESVRVTDTLPDNAMLKSAAVTRGAGTCLPTTPTVTCELNTIAPGADSVVSVTVVPLEPAPADNPMRNAAWVSGLTVDTRPEDNSAVETTVVEGLRVTPGGPLVTGISPSCGPTAGGTAVTITGQRLSGALLVRFGDSTLLPVTGFSVRSDTQIVAASPRRGEGEVPVSVTTAGGPSPTAGAPLFRYPCAGGSADLPPHPDDGVLSPVENRTSSTVLTAPPTGGGSAPGPASVPASSPLPGTAPAPGPGLSAAPGGGFNVAPQPAVSAPEVTSGGVFLPQGSSAPAGAGAPAAAAWAESETEPAPSPQYRMVGRGAETGMVAAGGILLLVAFGCLLMAPLRIERPSVVSCGAGICGGRIS